MNCKYARLLMTYRINCAPHQEKQSLIVLLLSTQYKKHFIFVLKIVLVKIFVLNF